MIHNHQSYALVSYPAQEGMTTMNEQDMADAARHRELEAQQLLDAYYSGSLQALASELASWHANYPHLFTPEIQALQRIIQLAIEAIHQLETKKGRDER
jgi:hypothetical protein